ncbi:MAG: hypothetical protein NTW97_07870 [Candidatus Krumholzibacteria bacterium]|nr:hypothetical protein [Candidatus Krumholzibacteria bacterium]
MEIALRFDPTLKAANALLGTYYMLNEMDQKAIDHYVQAIQRDPGEGEYWSRLARIYEFKEQPSLAVTCINDGIRHAPEFRQLYLDGFRVAARLGNSGTAKDYIRQWLDRHPEDREMEGILAGADKLLEDEFGLKPGNSRTGEKVGK